MRIDYAFLFSLQPRLLAFPGRAVFLVHLPEVEVLLVHFSVLHHDQYSSIWNDFLVVKGLPVISSQKSDHPLLLLDVVVAASMLPSCVRKLATILLKLPLVFLASSVVLDFFFSLISERWMSWLVVE